MSSIKIKTGVCIDCGPASDPKPIMAKRCLTAPYYHYRNHNAKRYEDNKRNRTRLLVDDPSDKALNNWFQVQINQMPAYCQECGSYLNHSAVWGPKTYVAHVLPKRYFKSVQTHPENRVFLCGQCHTNFDTWGVDKISKMKIFNDVLRIGVQLMKHLKQSEVSHLPSYLFDLL